METKLIYSLYHNVIKECQIDGKKERKLQFLQKWENNKKAFTISHNFKTQHIFSPQHTYTIYVNRVKSKGIQLLLHTKKRI